MPTVLKIKNLKSKAVLNPNLDKIRSILKDPYWEPKTLSKKGKLNQLSVSLDIDWDPNKVSDWLISFLFIPDVNKEHHEHIVLNHKEALKLKIYLDKYIKKVSKLKKKKQK